MGLYMIAENLSIDPKRRAIDRFPPIMLPGNQPRQDYFVYWLC